VRERSRDAPALVAAVGVLSGLGMAAVVAAVTGTAIVRLLDRSDVDRATRNAAVVVSEPRRLAAPKSPRP
jgi:hypothetical protein